MKYLLSIFLFLLALSMPAVPLADPSPVVHIDWRKPDWRPVTPILSRTGEPLFLRELYTLTRHEDFLVAADMGFNAVIERGEWVFDAANALDFWVTEANWFEGHFPAADAIDTAARFRDQPRLITYNLADEPDLRVHRSGPDVLKRAADLIREHDPKARFSTTLAGWGRASDYWPEYAYFLDLLRVDPYPLISNKPLDHVTELMTTARQVGGPATPLLCVLQAWSWPGGPFPDADQIRQMTWQALIAGAAGISYFDWNDAVWTEHPDFWREIRAINDDLAGPLDPFLRLGHRTLPIYEAGVAAAMWQLPDGRHAILITPLEHLPTPIDLRIQLPPELVGTRLWAIRRPGEGRALVLPADGLLNLPLANLQSIMLISASATANAQALSVGESWLHDWAGRPLHPVSSAAAPADYVRDEDTESPFQAAGLSLHVESAHALPGELNAAGLVHAAAAGVRLPLELILEADPESRATLAPHSWHDSLLAITGAALNDIITFEPVDDSHLPTEPTDDLPPRRRRYRLIVHLPAGTEWPAGRDHLLTFRLAWSWLGENHKTERVIRFRLQPATAIDWQWVDHATARVAVEPLFPPELYTTPPDQWRIAMEAKPLTLSHLDDPASTARFVHLAAPQSMTVDEPVTVTARVMADGIQLAHTGVAQLLIEGGNLVHPDDHRAAAAQYLPTAPSDADFDARWAPTATLPALRHFLNRGSHSYAADTSTGWFSWNKEALTWYMETEIHASQLRAETHTPDSAFLGDTLMTLLIQGGDNRLYYLQSNANRVTWDAVVAPQFDINWTPKLQIASRHHEGRWQQIVRLDWRDLGWSKPPEAGTALQLNIGCARDIAPRIWHTWHYWATPFNPNESLAKIVLRE